MLENAPQRPGVSEGSGNLVEQIACGIQTKVGCPLPGKVACQELIEHIWSEEATFDAD
jgi:hypothetical protein